MSSDNVTNKVGLADSSGVTVSRSPTSVVSVPEQHKNTESASEATITRDAVSVSLSDGARVLSTLNESVNRVDKQNEKPLNEKEAEKLAKEFEKLLSDMTRASGSTAVRFKVDLVNDVGTKDLNFQVVDKTTGEVLHSYPPEKVYRVLRENGLVDPGKIQSQE